MPSAWARAMCSAGTPRWNEMAWGWNSRVAANASSSNGRPVGQLGELRPLGAHLGYRPDGRAHRSQTSGVADRGSQRHLVPWPKRREDQGSLDPKDMAEAGAQHQRIILPPTRHLANPRRPFQQAPTAAGDGHTTGTQSKVGHLHPPRQRSNAALDPTSTAPDPGRHRPALRHGRAPRAQSGVRPRCRVATERRAPDRDRPMYRGGRNTVMAAVWAGRTRSLPRFQRSGSWGPGALVSGGGRDPNFGPDAFGCVGNMAGDDRQLLSENSSADPVGIDAPKGEGAGLATCVGDQACVSAAGSNMWGRSNR
jgi:hypothetical protein